MSMLKYFEKNSIVFDGFILFLFKKGIVCINRLNYLKKYLVKLPAILII